MRRLSYATSLGEPTAFVALALVGLSLAGIKESRAQVTLNLTPATGSGVAGSTITYYGTITNLSSSTVNLNSATFGSLSPPTSLISENDDGLFFGALAANSTYTGDIFSVTLDSTIQTSTYEGSVGILYNNGAATSNFQNFIINATGASSATPEPGTLPLVASAFLGIGVTTTTRRRRARRTPD